MKFGTIRLIACALALSATLLAPPVMAGVDASKPENVASVEAALENESSSSSAAATETERDAQQLQDELAKRLAKRRAAMLEEAHVALEKTNAAVEALDAGKPDEALEALALVTGKLELIVARDPELALAPVNVEFIKHELHATPATIRKLRDDAEALLAQGKVQEARSVLSGLASEIIVQVSNLPLATYPDAIKAISPLIDAGRIEEAKRALDTALSTLVVTKQVIPLPILRAESLLESVRAQIDVTAESEESGGMAESADRLEEVERLLAATRVQLERARLLGYGGAEEHERLRSDLAKLESRLGAGNEDDGLLSRLRKSLGDLQLSLFDPR